MVCSRVKTKARCWLSFNFVATTARERAMKRTAQCACGQVSAVVEGDPIKVFVCHCDYCQKRTGSVFGVTCYYPHERILELNGKTRVFAESANSIGIQYEFCPNCGTTVHWSYGPAMVKKYPALSQYRGFAVGCFADKSFPGPDIEVQRQYAHSWVPDLPVEITFDDFGDQKTTVGDS